MKGNRGWKGESYRHSLASRGIKSTMRARALELAELRRAGQTLEDTKGKKGESVKAFNKLVDRQLWASKIEKANAFRSKVLIIKGRIGDEHLNATITHDKNIQAIDDWLADQGIKLQKELGELASPKDEDFEKKTRLILQKHEAKMKAEEDGYDDALDDIQKKFSGLVWKAKNDALDDDDKLTEQEYDNILTKMGVRRENDVYTSTQFLGVVVGDVIPEKPLDPEARTARRNLMIRTRKRF